MTRYVLAHTADYGHFNPMRTVAVELLARGLDVAFVTTTEFADAARATGARVVPVGGVADRSSASIAAQAAEVPQGPEQINFYLEHLFIEPAADQFAAIQAEIDRDRSEPVVLVSDDVYAGAWAFALGAPGARPDASLALGTGVLLADSVDVAPFGSKLPPDASPEGRAANVERYEAYHAVLRPAQDRLEEVLRGVGAASSPPPFFGASTALTDRLLQLCPPGFEYPRSDLSPKVRSIGALPVAPHAAAEPPAWWHDLDTADRVVVVTQGTLQTRDPEAMIAPTLRALADEDVLVVATVGHDGARPRDVPDNARIVDFVPYDRLLPHADVLVSNGGFGGVSQAIAHGVPMVVGGTTEDKPEVTARVAWSGLGIDLGTDRPEPASVRAAVAAVLGETAYRDAARRLQAENSRYDPIAEILRAAEEVLAGDE